MGALANRIAKNFRHLKKWARRSGVSCFRVYDGDIPEHPVRVDFYEGRAVVFAALRRRDTSEEERRNWLAEVVREVSDGLEIADVFLRDRRRQRGSDQYTRSDVDEEVVVHEGGHRFLVNLSGYHDTGLFLDHRITRSLVSGEAADRRFLNLFCYTGSFTVYAAGGGATSSLSVDLSRSYLDWALRNFALNGLGPDHRVVRADVLQWLDQARERFDLIVCDPPTFSNSKRMETVFDVQRRHPELIEACLARLAPGGVLYFSCNRRGFSLEVPEGEEITSRTIPEDFRGRTPHRCWRFVR